MSWRFVLRDALDVILRIPPFFALNSILNGTLLSVIFGDDQLIFLGVWANFLIHLIVIGTCLVLVALSYKQLIYAYSLLLTSGVLIVSYKFNCRFIETQLELLQTLHSVTTPTPITELTFRSNPWLIFCQSPHVYLGITVVQCILAFSYNSLTDELIRSLRQPNLIGFLQPMQSSSYLLFLLPVIFMLSMPGQFTQYLPFISTFLAGLEFHLTLLSHIGILGDFFQIAWTKSWIIIHNLGLQVFVEIQWNRLHIPLTLRLFWLTRLCYHVSFFLSQRLVPSTDGKTVLYNFPSYDEAVGLAKEVLILGCDTPLSMLGMTSIVSLFMHYIGEFFVYVIGTSREEDHFMGTMSAILFLILALQSGLSSMPPGKRLWRLYCNLCLLMMAMLHFVHGMVHPELQMISAGRRLSIKQHARSLSICVFLIVFPLVVIFYLWSRNPLSTWLFSVVAYGIELVFKVLISLVVYGLFMIDATMDFWEGLDDYIYYVKSTGNTIEFLFGLLLFGNGAVILLFESGGSIRAFMMCIHAYFNIWTQAKKGWKIFIQRRRAATKISQLPEATASQLQDYADVCAICYHELTSARITKCRHFFHGVCLRKWLYIQDNCPLCHQTIYSPESFVTVM